jgi:hypothetical protein
MVTMRRIKRTSAGDAVTGLVLDLFRLNSLLLTAGDRLVARLGLTSARWQILGAIVAAERPQPVAWLARNLHRDGLVAFQANPHHRRAQLVVLTDKGRQTFDAAMRLQAPWINRLSDGLVVKDVETTHGVIAALRQKLEGNDEPQQRGEVLVRKVRGGPPTRTPRLNT